MDFGVIWRYFYGAPRYASVQDLDTRFLPAVLTFVPDMTRLKLVTDILVSSLMFQMYCYEESLPYYNHNAFGYLLISNSSIY